MRRALIVMQCQTKFGSGVCVWGLWERPHIFSNMHVTLMRALHYDIIRYFQGNQICWLFIMYFTTEQERIGTRKHKPYSECQKHSEIYELDHSHSQQRILLYRSLNYFHNTGRWPVNFGTDTTAPWRARSLILCHFSSVRLTENSSTTINWCFARTLLYSWIIQPSAGFVLFLNGCGRRCYTCLGRTFVFSTLVSGFPCSCVNE